MSTNVVCLILCIVTFIFTFLFKTDIIGFVYVCMYDSACEQCKLYDAGREAGATQVALQAGYCWHWKVTLALDGLC